MVEIRQGESQQELFREFSGETVKPERFPSLSKTQKPVLLHTSVEQLILAFILAILAFCLIFFLGVLRGKALRAETGFVKPLVTGVRSASPPASAELSGSRSLDRDTSVGAEDRPVISRPRSFDRDTSVGAEDRPVISRPYTIVLATYKKKSLADREAGLIEKSGAPAFVFGSGDYFVVCVGRYANRGEAKKDLKFFGSKYKGCYLNRR